MIEANRQFDPLDTRIGAVPVVRRFIGGTVLAVAATGMGFVSLIEFLIRFVFRAMMMVGEWFIHCGRLATRCARLKPRYQTQT